MVRDPESQNQKFIKKSNKNTNLMSVEEYQDRYHLIFIYQTIIYVLNMVVDNILKRFNYLVVKPDSPRQRKMTILRIFFVKIKI